MENGKSSLEILIQNGKYHYREWKGLLLYLSNGAIQDNYLYSTSQSYTPKLKEIKTIEGKSDTCSIIVTYNRLNTPSFMHFLTLNKTKGVPIYIESIQLADKEECKLRVARSGDNSEDVLSISVNKREACIYDIEGKKINIIKSKQIYAYYYYPNSNSYIIFNSKNNKISFNSGNMRIENGGYKYTLNKCACSEDILQDKIKQESGAFPREPDNQ